MKYSAIKSPPRMMRKEDAGHHVGGPKLLSMMEKAGWIEPVVARHKMTLYDFKQLEECCDRLSRGEFPHAAGASIESAAA